MRLGIVMPNWIGDAVMATPMLRALRDHLRHEFICGIMRPLIADTIAGSDWFDEIVYYDHRAKQRALGAWAVSRRMRQLRLNNVVLLTNSLRSGLLGWASGAVRRVGYARYGRGWLLTHPLQPKRDRRRLIPMSPIDYYLELLRPLGCSPVGHEMSLTTSSRDEQAADEAWQECNFAPGDSVIALNTGGAYGPAKDWPSDSFAELARRMANQLGVHVLIVCGPAERQKALHIEQLAAHPWVRSLANRPLSVGLTKSCLRRSSMAVSTDSGPRHIAAAFQVPVVALFGPTDPRWSENYHPLETRLSLELPCQPCGQRTCPLVHHQCMRELSVDRVFHAIATNWEERCRRVA
jgi:heptosyltransferase-2